MFPSKLPTCSNTRNLSLYLIYSYAQDEEELSSKARSKSNFKPFNLHPNQTMLNNNKSTYYSKLEISLLHYFEA
jgi:hypothetical protein